MQNMRNKDFINDTLLKVKGNITHEHVTELAKLIKDENISSKTLRTLDENTILLQDPAKCFRRRMTVDFSNPSYMNDNHKEDEDKSHLKVTYSIKDMPIYSFKENIGIGVPQKPKAPLTIHDPQLPMFRTTRGVYGKK